MLDVSIPQKVEEVVPPSTQIAGVDLASAHQREYLEELSCRIRIDEGLLSALQTRFVQVASALGETLGLVIVEKVYER